LSLPAFMYYTHPSLPQEIAEVVGTKSALRQGPCEVMMSDEIKIFNRIEKVCSSEAVLFV